MPQSSPDASFASAPVAPAEGVPPDQLPDPNVPPEAYAPGFGPETMAPPPPARPRPAGAGNRDDGGEPAARAPGEMGFFEHLEELRLTLIKSFTALFAGMVVVAAGFPWMFQILRGPLVWGVGPEAAAKALNTLTPFGVFSMVFTVVFCGGLALALPFILYFVAQFVAPGLTARERNLVRPALGAAFGLFAFGAALAYFCLLPAGLSVSFWLNQQLELNTLWNANDYFSLVTWMTFGTGLVFEFPLVLVALMALGFVEADLLARYRRHAVVVILIVAAVVTPSQDLLTLILMAAPMYALFEASLIVGRRLAKRREEALAAELPDTSD